MFSLLCRTAAQKEAWWERLSELVATERAHSPAGASINITYFHATTNFEHVSTTIDKLYIDG